VSRGRPTGSTDRRPRRGRSDAAARREDYASLRRGGMTAREAAGETGTSSQAARSYERWYQAGLGGAVLLRPGGDR
jgi:hypothetical protein